MDAKRAAERWVRSAVRRWMGVLLLVSTGVGIACADPNAVASPSPEVSEDDSGPASQRFHLSGYIQLQGNSGADGTNNLKSGVVALAQIGVLPFLLSELNVRRLRLTMTQKVTDRIDVGVQLAADALKPSLKDAYMRVHLRPDLTVKLGLFKVPWGYEGFRSSSGLDVIERSDVTTALYTAEARGVGVNLEGREPGYIWDLGFYQGDQTAFNVPGVQTAVGHVLFDLGPTWRVGGSVRMGTEFQLGTVFPMRRYDVEVHHDVPGWRYVGEYMWSDGFNTFADTNTVANGYYVAVTHPVGRRSELVFSYDSFDPNTAVVNPNAVDTANNRSGRAVIGWNVDLGKIRRGFGRNGQQRLMVDYEVTQQLEGPPDVQSGVRLQYQSLW